MTEPTLRAVDAVTVRVPDLEAGLAFYRGALGHELRWRDDARGMAGLALPDSATEIVLAVQLGYEPNWLVASVPEAMARLVDAGATVIAEPTDIPVGRVGVVLDPFGNALVVVDLSKGTYTVDAEGQVTDTGSRS